VSPDPLRVQAPPNVPGLELPIVTFPVGVGSSKPVSDTVTVQTVGAFTGSVSRLQEMLVVVPGSSA